MYTLKNKIILLEETDTIKDLAEAFANNTSLALYLLISEPQLAPITIESSNNNAITINSGLSIYDGTINIAGFINRSGVFSNPNSYAHEGLPTTTYITASAFNTLLLSPPSTGDYNLRHILDLLVGLVIHQVIGVYEPLENWSTRSNQKLSLLRAKQELDRCTRASLVVQDKLNTIQSLYQEVDSIRNNLKLRASEFDRHSHTATDITTGVIETDRLGTDRIGPRTLLNGAGKWVNY